MVQEAEGNRLDAEVDALVNAVNTQGVMGKGVALHFKTRFPKMFEAYRSACQAGDVKPGRMHVFTLGEGCQPRCAILCQPVARRIR